MSIHIIWFYRGYDAEHDWQNKLIWLKEEVVYQTFSVHEHCHRLDTTI
jgi:hypothetical protein